MQQDFTTLLPRRRAGRWLAVLALSVLPALAQAQTTYRWVNGNGAITGQNNWTPVRSSPQNTDILVFDGNIPAAAAPFVTVDAPITAGQLQFINGVNATLYTNGSVNSSRTITVNGGTGDDFVVSSNSQVTFNAESKTDLIVNLNGGATAAIAGTVVFNNTASPGGQKQSDHRLTGPSGSITFLSGSIFQQDDGAFGGAFGGNAGTATFGAGATFIQNSSSSTTPLGTNGDVTTFAPGSFYIYKAGSFATTGRTYGNLEFQAPATVSTGTLTIKNNLKVTSGTLTLGTGGILNVNLDGTAAQTVDGAGALAFGSRTVLGINNAAGVTLSIPATVTSALALTNGILNTSAATPLTLAAGAGFTGGSASSFVNGPLSRALASTAVNTSLTFPTGSGVTYRPLTLTLTQSSTANTTYTAQQFEGRPSFRTFSGDVQRVSYIRYYVLSSSGPASFANGSIKLNFGLDDQVDAAAKLRIARSNGAAWVSQGGTATPATNSTTYFAGDITSSTAFTQLGEFVLASTSAANGPGDNPLPVELTSFKALRQDGGVGLQWTTATEKNSRHFEVQRSTNGKLFRELGIVAGQGTTAAAHSYRFVDANAPAGLAYYRLKQVDLDGTEAFSPVAVVSGRNEVVALYPNPSTDVLMLPAADGLVSYRVFSLQGQTLLSGRAAGGSMLDVRRLPAGVFFLELNRAGKASIQRFLHE